MDAVEIRSGHVLRGVVSLAGSKSITNRALICAASSPGATRLENPARARDSEDLCDLLRRTGIAIEPFDGAWIVTGRAIGPRDASRVYDLGEGGTTARFFSAWVATGSGDLTLDAAPRMCERPMGALQHALIELGASVQAEGPGGCLPWRVRTSGLHGAAIRISTSNTSQVLSALLLIGPLLRTGRLEILRVGERRSEPYVTMTRRVMEAFGVAVLEDDARLVVPEGNYRETASFAIEPDASSAAILWTGAAMTGGRVELEGRFENAIQGDFAVLDHLETMGAHVIRGPLGTVVEGPLTTPLDVDLRDQPDLVPPLAVAAATLDRPSIVRGIAHLAQKESDRPAELERHLCALGATVQRTKDALEICGPLTRGAVIDPANDHRLAMVFALAGLVQSGVSIQRPTCVAKSFPDFFAVLARLAPGCVPPPRV